MRLESIQIEGFRSVISTVTVRIRPTLTCLVGANEHGKSNILEALYLLDGGEFSEGDRYAKSKYLEHEPHLEFRLALSNKERGNLRAALKAVLAELPTVPTDPEDATRDDVEAALLFLENNPEAGIGVVLNADSSRELVVGESALVISNEKWSGASKTLDAWYEESVPTVEMFEPEDELENSITLAELEAVKNVPFEGLLKLAGVWDERATLFEGSIKATALLVKGGRRLTQKLRGTWSQGARHNFHLHESGGKLSISIEDPSTHDEPSDRSLGFKSFLSFYLSLYAKTHIYILMLYSLYSRDDAGLPRPCPKR